ncbi:hypothetical protein N0V90_005063 [Kalmusia sp. IMI 367209]|nr:hypothetical protein N0V90_005063 [Kalmusia sp. IMI 367209]
MPETFLVLGAGLTGLPLAHYVLKHHAEKHDLKVILVSRSNEFYWNIGSPRAAIPGQFSDDKVFYSISKAFEKYSTSRFEFIVGAVETWDPDSNTVEVTQNDGHQRSLEYHTVIVATGSDYSSEMPWKLVGTHQQTHAALDKLRREVSRAKSIVVAGGGPTGVEFAGELGYEYAKAGLKEVTLVISEALPLSSICFESTRVAAKKELEKLNVRVVVNARVRETAITRRGQKTLEVTHSDGTIETLETDLFAPTWGVRYNTSFAPASMLEPNGRLKVTGSLRAPGYDNVFLLGDAANLPTYGASVRESQVRHIAAALGPYLAGGKLTDWKEPGNVNMTVAVGRGRGVGQIGGLNVWSWFVWMFKGRHMPLPSFTTIIYKTLFRNASPLALSRTLSHLRALLTHQARDPNPAPFHANHASLAVRLADVFARTWDLGFTAFGGPPVHFQILHGRFVEGRGGGAEVG